MKNRILLLFCLFLTPFSGFSQNWGVGIRGGDPSGISIKKYTEKNAWELNVGRTHWLYGDGWYNRRFDRWYEKKKYNYRDINYLGYSASSPIGIQLRYLIQKEANLKSKEFGTLDYYYGLGGQVRNQTFKYSYRYKVDGNPNWFYVESETVRDFDLGADAIVGLEYTFAEIPFSAFVDVNVFMEVIDDPFLFWGQGGIGIRYNF